jgi:glycosyltransferase involved in cell wall biosynthesis
MTVRDDQSVLVLGRAMHPPWNEGTRMIARGLAEAASELRSTRVISLTHPSFSTEQGPGPAIEHVAGRSSGYGPLSDWLAVRGIAARTRRVAAGAGVGVAHIVGLPLALAPAIRARGPRVIAHVTIAEHVYASRVDRLRAAAGWRVFDRWIDAYAASSPSVREALARQGVDERKLHLVPPPLALATFKPVDRAAARAALGIAPSTFAVVYMGTVSPLRFPAELVMRAFAEAAARSADLRLDIFAPVRTHEYNLEFAAGHLAAAAKGSASPVHIHLEDLAETRKAEVFSAADLVILPFAAAVAVEPPLTLLEAMACGAVVAVSPAANRSRLVRAGETGLTFADAPGLAGCIAEAAGMGEPARRALGLRARDEVTARHGRESVGRSLGAIWEAVGR